MNYSFFIIILFLNLKNQQFDNYNFKNLMMIVKIKNDYLNNLSFFDNFILIFKNNFFTLHFNYQNLNNY